MNDVISLPKKALESEEVPGILGWLGKLLNLVCLGLGFLWTAGISVITALLFLVSQDWGHKGHRLWARVLCFLMGIHVKLEGLENIQAGVGGVLAPNHESVFDIIVLAAMPVNFKWVSKAEVAKAPFIGRTMKVMGTYFVRRDRSGHDLTVLKEVEQGLAAGKLVVMFPEGTRTRTGELLPFKKGPFRVAIHAHKPIYPVAIRGTFAMAPPGKLTSRRGHKVMLRIGKPFLIPQGDDLSESMSEFRKRLVALLDS